MRVNSLFPVFALILLAGLSSAIILEDYLYPSENLSDISLYPLSSGAGNYTLVKIKGVDTFLIRGDSFVMSTDEITRILATHFFETSYPTVAELDNITAYVIAYNKSRDLPSTYSLPAESTCRQFFNIKDKTCSDRFSCTQACLASPLCADAIYGYGEPFATGMVSYGLALNQTETNFAQFFVNMEYVRQARNATTFLQSDVYKKLNASQENVHQMSYALNAMKSNNLLKGTCSGDCYDPLTAFCPRIAADGKLLDQAYNKLGDILSRLEPVSNIPASASSIYTHTIERQDHLASVRTNQDYEAKYTLADNFYNSISDSYTAITDIYVDEQLASEVLYSKNKLYEIRRSIDLKNFSSADFGLLQLYANGNATLASINNLTKLRQGILNMRSNASVLLLKAEWELDTSNFLLREQLETVKRQNAFLDDELSLKIDPANSSYFIEGYGYVANEANNIILTRREQTHDFISDVVLSGAKQVVRGSVGVVSTVYPMGLVERRNYSGYATPFYLVCFNLLVIILGCGSFIWAVYSKRVGLNRRSAILWTFGFILFFFLLTLVSMSMYYFFESETRSSNLDSFTKELAQSSEAAVVADFTDAYAPQSVADCATMVSAKFTDMGKNVSKYSFSQDACEVSYANGATATQSVSDCLGELSLVPYAYLAQSDLNATTFHTFYEVRVAVVGDAAYISQCDIVRVI